MDPLEQQLVDFKTELKGYFDKQAAGEAVNQKAMADLQKQVDAIDAKLVEKYTQMGGGKTVEDELKENDQIQQLLRDKRGVAKLNLTGKQVSDLFERKTTITSAAVGAATSGILTIDRIPGIVPEARQQLSVRDVLTARPTTQQVIDFVKVNSAMTAPSSPQVEGDLKPEAAVTFTTVSERVKTVAAWLPATRQILDDFSELMGFLQSTLPYYVNLAEETELLSGDNTGSHLHGLIPQATSFNTSLLSSSAGWNKIDIIGRAIQQITAAKELEPTFIVLHPTDFWALRLTKDGYGRYILGNPQDGAMTTVGFGTMRPTITIFGLTPVVTTSITSGTFLVGSGNVIAAEIRDRMGMEIDVSTEHSDYFIRNLVAVRAEKRLALVTKRPASFITGSWTTSP